MNMVLVGLITYIVWFDCGQLLNASSFHTSKFWILFTYH